MIDQQVLFSVDEGVGWITLNRPEKLNAFADRMRQELPEVVDRAANDGAVRVLVVTGAGRAFCAGGDIGYMRELIANRDWKGARALIEAGITVVSTIRAVPKPVIAAVNGPAAGGGANLALACDLRLASDRASLGQTFNQIGLHPDWGGTYVLPRLVGPGKALEMIFTGDMIDAEEGLRIGLFNRVVPHDQLLDETRALARRLAAKPPLALALAKQAIYDGEHLGLPAALERELANQLRCFETEDARHGVDAFIEKRRPIFRGV
jgi:2-(1,2-epoxy-1,2-dihydrophenyl)acetyl-CoA isomerase